eukprot:2141847-Rhodomonas_salina.1
MESGCRSTGLPGAHSHAASRRCGNAHILPYTYDPIARAQPIYRCRIACPQTVTFISPASVPSSTRLGSFSVKQKRLPTRGFEIGFEKLGRLEYDSTEATICASTATVYEEKGGFGVEHTRGQQRGQQPTACPLDLGIRTDVGKHVS